MTRILVIDDEVLLLRTLRINLTAQGYQVVTARTGAAGLRTAASQHPDVVVIDIGLPDVSGVEVLRILRSWMTVPLLVLSGRTDARGKTEWGILEVLVRNRGRLVDRESLLNGIRCPCDGATTNYLRVYLGQPRRKLEDDPSHPSHLLTQAGMGYRFQP